MFPKIMREIKTKADTDSPELTGIPTAPTPSDDTNTNQIANIEYITSKLENVKGDINLPITVDENGDYVLG